MTGARSRGKEPRYSRDTQRGGDLEQKRIDSQRISDQIADFERKGGRVEKLGTTRVLQKLDRPTEATGPAAGVDETD